MNAPLIVYFSLGLSKSLWFWSIGLLCVFQSLDSHIYIYTSVSQKIFSVCPTLSHSEPQFSSWNLFFIKCIPLDKKTYTSLLNRFHNLLNNLYEIYVYSRLFSYIQLCWFKLSYNNAVRTSHVKHWTMLCDVSILMSISESK